LIQDQNGCEAAEIARLVRAGLHEILALRAHDRLIDRLLEAVEMRLRHAKLHLVSPFLAFDRMRSGRIGHAVPFSRDCKV
jgi:hypothetical protein